MKHGFKAYATRLALVVRQEVDLDAFEVFDPYVLAADYGIDVDALTKLPLDGDARQYLLRSSERFSGALLSIDGRRRIIENDLHAHTRRRATVSHEMSHVILEHTHAATIRYDRCTGLAADQEDEASWFAGELLIPYDAALRQAWAGAGDEDVARRYQVSPAEARWRMNNSGVRKLVARSRAKRRRGHG